MTGLKVVYLHEKYSLLLNLANIPQPDLKHIPTILYHDLSLQYNSDQRHV